MVKWTDHNGLAHAHLEKAPRFIVSLLARTLKVLCLGRKLVMSCQHDNTSTT